MELLASVLNVIIIIASVLLVLLVLIQTSKNDMGLFQSTSQSVFGSRGGDVLTKTTSILAAIFLLGSFALAYLKVNIHKSQEASRKELQKQESGAGSSGTSAGEKKPEAATDTKNQPKANNPANKPTDNQGSNSGNKPKAGS